MSLKAFPVRSCKARRGYFSDAASFTAPSAFPAGATKHRHSVPKLILALLLVAALVCAAPYAQATTIIPQGAAWRYFKGTAEASVPRHMWRLPQFDDSAWMEGNAPFGYGRTGFGTVLEDMHHAYTTLFIRRAFEVARVEDITRLQARIDYDDGFLMWINGEPVLSANAPTGEITCASVAAAAHQEGKCETFEIPHHRACLVAGANCIAVQVFNLNRDSRDCKFDLELFYARPVAEIDCSPGRGFFDDPFEVSLTTKTDGATVVYSTDGSVPDAVRGLTTRGSAAHIRINTTTILRARGLKNGHDPSHVATHTYIFPTHVRDQPESPPPGYPRTWGMDRLEDVVIPADYGMEPAIVNDPAYRDGFAGCLKAVPSLSLVMEPARAFDGESGLFCADWQTLRAAARRGEREYVGSIELIYPPGQTNEFRGFQANCLLKPHGRNPWKRSLRIKFTSRSGGPPRLRYPALESAPLHSDSAAGEFEDLVLRAGTDRCFAGRFVRMHPMTTYTRDQWARDTQLDMTGFGSRGTFVHLYVNGLYWGLYNLCERPAAAFAAAYFGGKREDWSSWNSGAHTSGRRTQWDRLCRFVQVADLADPRNYGELADYLDVTNFVDDIILHWYCDARDWPGNNWHAFARERPPGPVRFCAWDSELSWMEDSIASDEIGGVARIPDEFKRDVSFRRKKHIPIFRKLCQNPAFRLLFADRLHRHLHNDGALSDRRARARWTALCDFVEDAIVCESARWGDTQAAFGGPVFTPHDHWYTARDRVLGQMTGNGQCLIRQCRDFVLGGGPLYPALEPPVLEPHGGKNAAATRLSISARAGQVYYTLDGPDPAGMQGAASRTAMLYRTPIELGTTIHVKARANSDGIWSALSEATFCATTSYDHIRITELMYNPRGGSEFEFIEIGNMGDSPVGLANMAFRGISYRFPAGAELAAGQYLVLARNPGRVAERYGLSPYAAYAGKLDNAGETIALLDADGRTVTAVTCDDSDPWPTKADGNGHSIERLAGPNDPNDAASWRARRQNNGSPGRG
ncbi:MAG: CotH kinase family protein [Kiritimatiellae bacterium]|nr:CotH kinase family protein [Kiritimatiellia bacterium]